MKKQVQLNSAKSRKHLLNFARNNSLYTQTESNRLIEANSWVVVDFDRGVCVTFPVKHNYAHATNLPDMIESILRYKNNE